MLNDGNNVRVLSANCQGLNNIKKRKDVLSYYKEKEANIICLQDTHLMESDIASIKEIWNNEVYICEGKSNSRGIIIILNNNFECEVLTCKKDTNGNYLNLLLKLNTLTLNLITIYGPNNDSPSFFKEIADLLENQNADYTILCGDFNIALNNEMDTTNYKNVNNPKAKKVLQDLMQEYNLSDMYREIHPETKRFTWRRKNPVKQARLDLFIASSNILDITNKCEIKGSYRSDHSSIELELIINKFVQGKGLWKFNNSLLKSEEYLNLVDEIINDEKLKYALPVYDINFLKNNYANFEITIDHDIFLEMLLLRIRGETVKFVSREKKKTSKIENKLIDEIETLESQESMETVNSSLLQDKKSELETIRAKKIEGQIIRSRMQWLQDGEKPTKYFCNLENKAYTEKTLRKVKLDSGEVVMEQEKILNEIHKFYSFLFENKDTDLKNINFDTLGIKSKMKFNDDMGTAISVEEVGPILKKMKSNKSPGIDGITVEFLKVFWRQLKYFIVNAINCSFSKGILPNSLRQCIITCIPKPNKDRALIKNWRPISLLSVIYKLMSSTIAERLKKTLNDVISSCQTGFIQGRYISDSTRLIYDLMRATEIKNMSGLLMLIDFEKALDSLSWKFLYKTLDHFGYSESFIKWIQLFNTDISAYVVQCGFLSKPITIGRGCRQ